MSYLIFGGNGWIGNKLYNLLRDEGKEVHIASSRMENREHVAKELDEIMPEFVLNCAGKTGRPNIDWCETHKAETLISNVIGPVNLADLCDQRGIHFTNYASGCIYTGYEKEFSERDEPNFTGSYYSFTKVQAEKLLSIYPNVLHLRLRMPISDDLSPRSFIYKILHYKKVIDKPNSMTILSDLLPISLDMIEKKETGIYNFCNPGSVSHNQILSLYKKYVDNEFTWTNFTVEEQEKVLLAPRSNCVLNTGKLNSLYKIPNALESIENIISKW